MPPQRPTSRRGGPSDHQRQGQTRGRGRGDENRRPQRQSPTKFRGNCIDLQGQVFDCSDYKQADTFVNTLKRISEYIGAEYKHGGDIHSSILHKVKIIVPLPIAPIFAVGQP